MTLKEIINGVLKNINRKDIDSYFINNNNNKIDINFLEEYDDYYIEHTGRHPYEHGHYIDAVVHIAACSNHDDIHYLYGKRPSCITFCSYYNRLEYIHIYTGIRNTYIDIYYNSMDT